MSNQLLDAALAYARRGWAVFPCNAAKKPYTDNGVLDATTDEAQIRAWWSTFPKANIGFDVGGAGLMVVDLDPNHSMAELEQNVGPLPQTLLRQATPRGGEHLFFELAEREVVSPSTSKIADHVDVRSFHSYVLLAPSRTADGAYTWVSEGKPAYRTDELVRVANSHREKHKDRDKWLIEPDLDENIALAIDWLKTKAKPAIEGRGGDHTAYATAAMLKSFGISPELSFDLMWEHWNPRCVPPWSGDEADHLQRKVENGHSYNTSPPGNMTPAYAVAKTKSLFKATVEEVALPSGRELTRGRFRIVDRHGMKHIRPPRWLVQDLLPEGAYGLIYGHRGTYKTFVALDIAMSVATGFCASPTWQAENTGPVLFAAGEGRPGLNERVEAWESKRFGGVLAENFHLIDPVPRITEEPDDFVGLAEAMSPTYKLIVLDTMGRAMQGTNENSQEHASAFTMLVETLQRKFDCAVLAIHHAGHEGATHARGSSVIEADADMILRVQAPKRRQVELVMTKQKDAAQWEEARVLSMLEHGGSLVAMPCAEKAEAQPAMSKTAEAAREIFGKQAVFQVLDQAVASVLAANKMKEWSTAGLADALAMRPEIDIPSATLRTKWLGPLRESKVTRAHFCYSAMSKRWRYSEGN